MRPSGSMRAQIGTLILATSGIQLANGFFGTLISLRVAIEDFESTMAGLVLSSYFAGFTLGALRCGRIIERVGQLHAHDISNPHNLNSAEGIFRKLSI
jgi:MFS family permease